MNLSTIAPILIAYLLGCATPVFIASRIKQDREEGEGCLFTAILVGIVIAIILVVFLWISETAV